MPRPNLKSSKPGKRLSWQRKAAWIILAALGVPWLSFQVATRTVPLPPEILRPVEATTTLVDARGTRLGELPGQRARLSEPGTLAAMGRWLPVATVALEDHRFFQHAGIDWQAMAAAGWRNLRTRRIVSGGSTITQQLIKLSQHRSRREWWAKIYEPLAAARLERLWSKERILEEYLNRVDYGNRYCGPVAAARVYFKKQPGKLTLPEAIYLAGLPQAPTDFNPLRRPQAAAVRYQRSLSRLAELKIVNAEERELYGAPPSLTPNLPPARLAPHFVDALLAAHPALPGGRSETTLDLDLQRFVEQEVQVHLSSLASGGGTQAAAVVLNAQTGAVCAMVGSRDYSARKEGQINGALDFRSAGSTLKPFLYLRAIDQRLLTAASLLPDTPDAIRNAYADYDPSNYDKRYWGPVRVREALANSLNVPAVVTLSRLGARPTYHALEEFGFTFRRGFDDYGAGMILGNAEIRLLDLTSVFTVFAGDALAVTPRYLKSTPPRHRSLASTSAVAIVGDILSDNDARLKSFGAFSPLAFEHARIPCKTGTSAGFRDAWTVGVTREHSVGVWVGNFDGHGMQEVAAITSAAPLWHDLVAHLLRSGDHSVPPPIAGEGLIKEEICQLTGLRPGVATTHRHEEWFLPGTMPIATADSFFCLHEGKTQIVLPPEYGLWCQSRMNYLGAKTGGNGTVRIVNPRPNSIFVIDPSLPRAQQAIHLVATERNVKWSVDHEVVPSAEGPALWTLLEGTHTVRAETATGHVEQQFTVESGLSERVAAGPAKTEALEIDLTEQKASLRINGVLIRTFPISSGRSDHPTPTGEFKVLRKEKSHFSSLYGRLVGEDGQTLDSDANGFAPLGKGQRFVPSPMRQFIEFDSGNGLHAGPLPGYPASHGCVRLLPADANLCFEHLEVGDPIHIIGEAPSRRQLADPEVPSAARK